MALAPWEIDRRSGVSYSTSPTRTSTASGSDFKYRDPGSYVRLRSSTPTRTTSSGGYSSGGSTRTSTRPLTVSRPQSSSTTDKREVTKRTPGPLPLSAEELAAFGDQRRAITRQAQLNIANAERARAAALEAFVTGRFGLQSQAEDAIRDTLMQASARGRGQARSTLATGVPLQALQGDLSGGLGTLNRNLAGTRAAADAAKTQAEIDRDANLAKLERNLALRQSMPSGFFAMMGS